MKTSYGNAGVEIREIDAYYTETALLREGRAALAAELEAATAAMRDADRAFQDQSRPVSRAIAHRDLIGADLDDTAREVQARLHGRSADAKNESPATDVLEGGLGALVGVKIEDRAKAFQVLLRRIEDHLPAADPVRVEFVPVLLRQLQDWDTAQKVVTAASVEFDARRSRRARSFSAWQHAMVRIYGRLVEAVGKKKAERFFRKSTRAAKSAPVGTEAATESAPEPATEPSAVDSASEAK